MIPALTIPALTIPAWLIALLWLWKAITTTFGLRRIPNLTQPHYNVPVPGDPSLTVIVPARNEAANIAATLQSLLHQDYPHLRIIALDDRSTDDTGKIITALANLHPQKLTAISITQLPSGWLGKTHAMALAARHAISLHHPQYLLFTDADILFYPTVLRLALAHAVATRADHLVILPTTLVKTPGEGMLLGYLQVMGLWAVRLWRVANPKSPRDAVGVGAFNLLCTPAYQHIGGFDNLRMEILEDVNLGRRIKQSGLRQRIAFAPNLVTVHWASGISGILQGMTKNLFAIFNFRSIPLVLASVLIGTVCLAPFAFLLSSHTRTPALLALASIAILYILSSRHSRISPWYAALFPISAILFLYSLIRSMFTTLRNGGVTWRDTFYPLAELRKRPTPQPR